jgi:hypothetical protein
MHEKRAHATPQPPSTTEEVTSGPGMAILAGDPAGTTARDKRAERRRLLSELPTHKLQFILEVVDAMVEYHEISACVMRECDAAPASSSLPLFEEAGFETELEYSFVKLCEETSRRIANSKSPRGYKSICKLDGTVEGRLIREAMLEEVLWMIEKGKVVPRDKRTLEEVVREIDGQWVIVFKKNIEGLLDRVRARWVLRGDTQVPYVDYDPHSVYSPVASKTSTITAMVLAVQFGMLLFALDVSKAFTVSKPNKKGLFMRVPKGVDSFDPTLCPFGPDTTWELLTSLYGLKTGPADYYCTLTKALLSYTDSRGQKYRVSDADPCVFTKGVLGSDDYIMFSVHVDDKFIACTNQSLVDELVSVLCAKGFECKIEPMSKVLGMRVHYTKYTPGIPGSGVLQLCHKEYIQECYDNAAKHFKGMPTRRTVPMTPAHSKRARNPKTPVLLGERYKLFRKILGQVSHCANFTHPEICTAVSMISQYMSCPTQEDLSDVWNVMCYLRNAIEGAHPAVYTLRRNESFCLRTGKSTGPKTSHPVHLVCDADLSNCTETRRSRTGYCLYLFGNLVGWSSTKQKSVALSTAESEYIAMSTCAQFGKWYMELLKDVGLELAWYEPFVLYSDSKSAIAIANSKIAVVNKYSKHVERRVHWFRELVRANTMRVLFVAGTSNTADIFTKCLSKTLFLRYRGKLLLGDFADEGSHQYVQCVQLLTKILYDDMDLEMFEEL